MIKLGTLATLTSFLGLGIIGCSTGQDSTESATQHDTTIGKTCSPEQQAAALKQMLSAPIQPPRFFGGLDLAGGEQWAGLTIDAATQTACQATDLGTDDVNESVGWGPNQEVTAEYNNQTRKINFVQMSAGYTGTLDFKSRSDEASRAMFGNGDANYRNPFGQHTYSIGVGKTILRDGQPFLLDWKNFDPQATELFDAIMATFGPDLPSTQTNCRAAQTCLARNFDGEGLFGARPLGMYFHIPTSTEAQPASSTPDYLYAFWVKTMPFSGAETFLKLDNSGPVATANGLGDRSPKANCVIKFGQTLQDVLDNCVDILQSSDANAYTEKKFLGGAYKSEGKWLTDTSGIVPGFTVLNADEHAPSPKADVSELVFDIRANGKQVNEYSSDGATFTMGGTAAIYREYARLVQNAIQAELPADMPRFPIGAPECLLPAGGDPATWKPARGCTGMESFITPAAADTGTSVDTVSMGVDGARLLGITSALKASSLVGAFCADPGRFDHCGFDNGDTLGATGDLFKTSADHLAAVLGGDMPKDARVPLFYVRQFAHAQVKYLRAAAQFPTDLSKPEFDQFEATGNDLVIETTDSNTDTVKYKSVFQETVFEQASLIQDLRFRR